MKTLPTGYRLDERFDLIRNRRQFKAVMILSVVLALIALAAGMLWNRSASERGLLWLLIRFAAALAGCCLYIVGHEAVHGLLMWLFSGVKPRFGFTLMYAYAGSDVCFAKAPYLLIAIAPLLVWTVLLTMLAAVVTPVWFWPIWVVQVFNLSGCAGDVYVFARLLRKPSSILVKDTGTAMSVFRPA